MIRNVAVWKETTPVHNQSRIKQGDVINPALFNAGLGDAMSAWKQHLGCHGASVGLQQRLTNIRYADDLLHFGDGEDELVYMLQFFPELSRVGLFFFKTKVFTTQEMNVPDPDVIIVNDEHIDVMKNNGTYQCLECIWFELY